jgi:hypothetical protein
MQDPELDKSAITAIEQWPFQAWHEKCLRPRKPRSFFWTRSLTSSTRSRPQPCVVEAYGDRRGKERTTKGIDMDGRAERPPFYT